MKNFEGKIKQKKEEIQFLENFISFSLGGQRARFTFTHIPKKCLENRKEGEKNKKIRFKEKKVFFFLLVPSLKIYVEINFVRDYWMWNNMDNEDDEKEIYMRMTLMGCVWLKIWPKGKVEWHKFCVWSSSFILLLRSLVYPSFSLTLK